MIIGAEVSELKDIPAGMVSTIIKPTNRVVFDVEKGGLEKVGEAWMKIWQATQLEKTFISEYELYHSSGKVEIYIGVK